MTSRILYNKQTEQLKASTANKMSKSSTTVSKAFLFQTLTNTMGENNNTFSGETEEKLGQVCIYAYEKEQLDQMIKPFKLEYEIVEEFVDGNRDECLVLECKEG